MQVKFLSKAAGVCCLMVPCIASATNWITVVNAANNAVWYIDTDSVKRVSDGYSQTAIKVWVRADNTLVKNEPAREIKELLFFKCDEEKMKIVTIAKYRADGAVIGTYSDPYPTYDPVIPDSISAGIMDVVCKS